MKQNTDIEIDAVVVQDLSNSIFKCELDNGLIVQCTLGSRIRMNNIRVLVGDKVRIVVSAYDTSRGRIIYRFNPGETQYKKQTTKTKFKSKKGK